MIGFALAIFPPETIRRLIGSESGLWGVLAAAVIGSVTLIPGFVAFPLAAALLKSGAGVYAARRVYFHADDGWRYYDSD